MLPASRVHPRFHTPHVATSLTRRSSVVAVSSSFTELAIIANVAFHVVSLWVLASHSSADVRSDGRHSSRRAASRSAAAAEGLCGCRRRRRCELAVEAGILTCAALAYVVRRGGR
jgi:hypothetical protein